ncbi:PP2C family protein-serine/threonine phosphatase [Nocardioides jiangxiensis]|uniref:PP2C family protein-serine/threonine phosphatase n=1 Tax=Nocardioides jiangxiensis TaxID=3064524 RepID=A0ABT9B2I6_9ACTN|nr:PP2C family protein-serine/threonine phosphatase [Nocardioides sp. WY-20]MDO7869059.1 PP2C family protein-serine/threonine phosphatase [Nocardioides sp. WY-20]
MARAHRMTSLATLRGRGQLLVLYAHVVGVLACAAVLTGSPDLVPITVFILPLFFASHYLGPKHLPWYVVFLLGIMLVCVAQRQRSDLRTAIGVVVVFALAFLVLRSSFRRSRLGVSGPRGESMLVDLRDRILSQGMLPPLPAEWYAETALRSAGGTPFAGDFVVASRPGNGRRLELVVVDVSGKGEDAGTRSLLLSGAFSGLLNALPPREFLPAANDYLIRQDWDEGFATAIHLSLDLCTGDFELRAAGHPPAVQLVAGAGRWVVHPSEGGTVLGVLEDAEFPAVTGTMRRGDALLLYTDGLVENRSRDIALGIDRLQGQGERLLRTSMDDGARRLIDKLGSRNDDRALLLVHRR